MHHPIVSKPGSGFTLIEMMISISLGLALLLTCFAGLRLTAQTLVTSKRLSEENALLRLGVEHAWEEADFWTLCDDPTNVAQQPLRGAAAGGGFQPFTPFAQTPDYTTDPQNGTIGFVDATTTSFDESSVHGGWNPHPLAWAAWNPRNWTRACVAEKNGAEEAFGTCEIYDNLDPKLSWHYWYDDQVRSMMDAVGFYGILEYLPSNTHFIYHGLTGPLGNGWGMDWGGCPSSLMSSGWFAVYDGSDDNMKGRERNSNGSRYFFPGPATGGSNLSRTFADFGYNGRNSQNTNATTGNSTGVFNLNELLTAMTNSFAGADLMPARPNTWSDITYETHRFIERGHPLCLCEVRCASVSGSNFLVPFTCVCTTLRGARQQRTLSGWVVNPYTDATLDYTTPP